MARPDGDAEVDDRGPPLSPGTPATSAEIAGSRRCQDRARLLMRAVSSVTCVYVARRSLIRLVIFLTACMTVVWSLPPKEAPIRGRDSSVSSRHRYMAICRAFTSVRLRL